MKPPKTPIQTPKTLSEVEISPILRGWPAEQHLDDYMIYIQKQVAMEAMEREVEDLCGPRYTHDPTRRYQRWGVYEGSIRIRSEWVPIRVPRVRDTRTGTSKPLKIYQTLRELSEKQQMRLVDLVFRGISQRNYQQVTRECADSFGLSASTVSRIFQARTGQILREFEERDLSAARYVVVMMDATRIRDRHIMICLGITQAGTKTVLGFAELFTENAEAIEGLLMRMIQRGLRYEQGILFVVDGAKGIHGAITAVFGGDAHIQRCTQHKRENVKGSLRSEKQKSSVERKLNAVYLGDQTYSQAKQELETIQRQLEKDGHTAAANSLQEGMEDTLTLHRLGVCMELRSYLRTTNIMESLHATVKERYRKIRRWTSSEQCHRWIALGVLEAETKVKNIPLKKDLAKLKKALMEHVRK